MDNQYQQKLTICMKKLSQSPRQINTCLRQILNMPTCYAWKILEEVLKQLEKKSQFELNNAIKNIEYSATQIKSFTMLIYLYALARDHSNLRRNIYWKSYYIKIALDGGQITIFSTWVSLEPQANIVQQSLWMIVSTFPSLFRIQNIQMSQIELNSALEWVNYLKTSTSEGFSGICQLVKMAKQTHLYIREDYIRKQHLILKKLIEVVGQSQNSSSNVFLFIYPFTLQQKDISYFCHVYCDFITDLAEDNLVNFFKAITKSSVSKQLIFLIMKISQLLRNQEEYFKLRVIYQSFILPYLIRRAKSCNKAEQYVYQLSSFFILGFLKHCNLGDEGINCILYNIQKVKNQNIKNKWIQICGFICFQYPERKKYIVKILKQKVGGNLQFNYEVGKHSIQNQEVVWNVTIRSGRKHKKYPKVISKLKGIQNKHNECYIISTVQGLQKTGELTSLLDNHRNQIKGNLLLLDQLRVLFGQISGKRKANVIKVTYLKRKGPQFFTQSDQQQDVQHYLLQLFTSIQNQCSKVPGLLQKFKSIYEIQIRSEIRCQKCGNQVNLTQKEYIYTIPHTQVLKEVSEKQQLPDYTCQKCSTFGSTIIRKIQPQSKILIVHINRFSHQNGQTYKQLSTQMIHRKFLKYTLVGMICHIGKNVQHGHYVYYGRLGQKRWAQFNDRYVQEFDLIEPNQQFQRQMKAEMTPYILFYKQI